MVTIGLQSKTYRESWRLYGATSNHRFNAKFSHRCKKKLW